VQPTEVIRTPPSTVDGLERALALKQLQINRLLNITQAINENVAAEGLFSMYSSLLNWEVSIRLMALYFRQNDKWTCAAHIGLSEAECNRDISHHFIRFEGLSRLEDEDDPLLAKFKLVIPVRHKDEPLAYVFLGDEVDSAEMYNVVQFVTTITNVIAVAIENKRLFQKQLRQERYQTELALATDIQRSLIPDTLPSTDQYAMAGQYIPRFGVGGDFYSAERFEDGRLLFCMADIAGKGTGAALLMSNFEASFWTLARSYFDMDEFVRNLNAALFRVTRGERFVTLFTAEYNPATQQLTYVNAGHNPPLFMCGSKDVANPDLLEKGCIFLGAFETLPPIEIGTLNLSAGGLLFCYTDGVTELSEPGGDMYGEERLHQYARANCHKPVEEFNTALVEELYAFQQDAEAADDVALLSVRFKGQNGT